MDTLQSRRVLFDLAQRRIFISRGRDRLIEPASSDEIVVQARSRFGRLILSNVEVNGTAVQVVIDTGAEVSIGNAALARLLRKSDSCDCPNRLVDVTGATAETQLGYLGKVRIGPIEMQRVPVAFADADFFRRMHLDGRPALLLGMDIIRRFSRVSLDFETRQVRFLVPAEIARPVPAIAMQ